MSHVSNMSMSTSTSTSTSTGTSVQCNSYYSGFHRPGGYYEERRMGYWEEGEDPYKSDGDGDGDGDGEDRSYVGDLAGLQNLKQI